VARIPRTAVLIAVAALVLAGAAYAVTSLPQSGSPTTSSTQPAWLGVQLIPVPAGALVASVVPGSPAQAAGLRAGDVITQIQGRPVVSPINVTNAIDVLNPGQIVQLQIQRGSRTFNANATLAARPARFTSP
jgi:S1-C subfamily serine protease